jgi:geranylgeranyl diphosphate synthase, type I
MLGATTQPSRTATPSALAPVTEAVEDLLATFLDARTAGLAAVGEPLGRVGEEIRSFVLTGGKRLRPAFVYWGHRATGEPPREGVMWAAAAVELLHNFALIHDDVMDRSTTRRGRPTVHEALRAAHRADGLTGDEGWFGVGGAILAGDIAFVWADQLLDRAPLPAEAKDRARAVFTELRVEVMAGQYLDLRLAGAPDATVDDALDVALLKSGRYTVTRPLQLGAAIGRSDDVLDAALRAFGDAVGVAFQLRDDILGLFGDPQATGKSAVGDLREGKRTALILEALRRADPDDREALVGMLGRQDLTDADADRAREIIVDSGALTAIEEVLEQRRDLATRALAPVEGPARGALEELADLALHRSV